MYKQLNFKLTGCLVKRCILTKACWNKDKIYVSYIQYVSHSLPILLPYVKGRNSNNFVDIDPIVGKNRKKMISFST